MVSKDKPLVSRIQFYPILIHNLIWKSFAKFAYLFSAPKAFRKLYSTTPIIKMQILEMGNLHERLIGRNGTKVLGTVRLGSSYAAMINVPSNWILGQPSRVTATAPLRHRPRPTLIPICKALVEVDLAHLFTKFITNMNWDCNNKNMFFRNYLAPCHMAHGGLRRQTIRNRIKTKLTSSIRVVISCLASSLYLFA